MLVTPRNETSEYSADAIYAADNPVRRATIDVRRGVLIKETKQEKEVVVVKTSSWRRMETQLTARSSHSCMRNCRSRACLLAILYLPFHVMKLQNTASLNHKWK